MFEQLGEQTQTWLSELEALAQRWADAGGEPSTGVADLPTAERAPIRVGQAADEVVLVASLVAAPWQYPQIETWLTPEDFTRDDMRGIYLAIAELHQQGRPLDEVTIMWAVLRSTTGSNAIDGECLRRFREAGIPGYAPIAARQILNASLLRTTADAVAKIQATARLPRVRQGDLIAVCTSHTKRSAYITSAPRTSQPSSEPRGPAPEAFSVMS